MELTDTMSTIMGAADAPACRVRELKTFSEVESLADLWRALWSDCIGVRTPYLSYEWVITWARHFVPEGDLRILVVENAQGIAGIMPLFLVRSGLSPFRLAGVKMSPRHWHFT